MIQVAIDGPAAAGKSTVARRVAERLGYLYVDTGAMYRAITLKALEEGVPLDDPDALAALARRTVVDLRRGTGGDTVWLDGRDVTRAIRRPEVTRAVSQVSAVPGVRQALVAQQRRLAAGGGVVMEGRDIGTNVLPGAEVKVYLTASEEERARRRHRELAAAGYTQELTALVREIRERDTYDAARAVAPLRRPDDATVIDSTALDIDAVVERVLALCREALARQAAGGAGGRPARRR